jgi:hypothetical protein
VPGLLIVLFRGLNYSVEFTGGTLMQVESAKPVDVGAIRNALAARGIEGAEIQTFGSNRELVIRARVAKEGTMGIGESYMDAHWDCEALDELFHRLALVRHERTKTFARYLLLARSKLANLQSRARAREGEALLGPGAMLLKSASSTHEYLHVDDGGDRTIVFEYEEAFFEEVRASFGVRRGRRAFDHLAEADAESVVVAGQPPGSAYFALQVLGRADGKLRWSTTPRKQPAVWRLDRGELFELTATHLHRYDARSGETLWSHALEAGAAMRGIRPAEADVTLVGADGRDVRLDRASGAPR